MGELARVVRHVASDEGLLALGADANAHMARRVAMRGHEIHFLAEAVRGFDELRQAGVEDRLHGIGEHQLLDPVPTERRRHAFAPLPEVIFRPVEEIAGVREGRPPLAIDQHGVPPDVIDMQVRAEDGVDRVRGEALVGKLLEEAGAQHVKRRTETLLVVAGAGVDDDALRRRLDDERVDARDRLAILGQEVGA